ncbi:MAG: PepSY-like domain-containing protein [Microbacter sp.]
MKKQTFIFGVIMFISLSAFGQSKSVPVKVKAGFEQKFKQATNVKWSRENAKEWEAEFTLNGKPYSANFNNEGGWLETEHRISLNEIPSSVKAAFEKECPGFSITQAEISETEHGMVYEMDINKGKVKKEVAFDVNGKRIAK